MFKKTIGIVSAIFFLSNASYADTTNIGVKLSYGSLEATGTETTDKAGSNSGGTVVDSGSGDGSFPFASLFVEREIELDGFNVALGLDYVPFEAEVDKLGGGDGTDATVELKDHFTVYVQPSKKLDNGITVFGKLGYSQADVKISEVTRQATTGGDTASTDTGATRNLEGPTVGLGIETDVAAIDGAVRLEYSYTDYDDISYTNSNSKVLTAKDIELQAINLSFVKKF
jgi:hypothetical protein